MIAWEAEAGEGRLRSGSRARAAGSHTGSLAACLEPVAADATVPDPAQADSPTLGGTTSSAWAPTPFVGQPHADGEAIGQDEPYRAAERFRTPRAPSWRLRARAARRGLVVGRPPPRLPRSVRRLASCWAGPARPRPSGAARHRRSRYRGRSGRARRARPAGRAWPRHRRRSRSPPVGRGAGSVWSCASLLACSELQALRWCCVVGWTGVWALSIPRRAGRLLAPQVVLRPAQRSRFIRGRRTWPGAACDGQRRAAAASGRAGTWPGRAATAGPG